MSVGFAAISTAQIPDLLTAFDAGGRSMGMGSSLGLTGSDTRSTLQNPASLGYVSQPVLSIAFRNLGESRTQLRNDFNDPDFRTNGQSGNRAMTHLGYATPSGNGVLGFSYQVMGYVRDFKFGTGLRDGNVYRNNYRETTRAKTDAFTVSFARSNAAKTNNFGVGVVVAAHNTRNRQAYNVGTTPQDPGTPVTPVENSGSLYGVGITAGMQFQPGNNPNALIGISAQSPISLSGSSEISDYYNRIPGRLSAGIAQRTTTGRASDFLLLGAQLDYYFGGSSSGVLERDNQFVIGTGAEYHYKFRNAYIPLRAGFRAIGKGGDGFSGLTGLTFGLGYHPIGSDYGVDIDFSSLSTGGMDMSLSLTYKF